ncbi:unnamed protein product [Macrosiphum euphorbiae]|uniref:Uncharacterized protein n=1 Tax=Macrosiphum euphorbiae TaxID=13131 RepID=A0AAV0WFL5_9HEMI|nr:unnamed protein product [Macrosiphum euphorbiae]
MDFRRLASPVAGATIPGGRLKTQGSKPINQTMNGTTNNKLVTGPVGLGPHSTSWIGASSPAVPFFTLQGRAKWKPHTRNDGSKPENKTTAMPEHTDKLYRMAPLGHRPPLRLRGGNRDISDNIDTDNDQGDGQIIITSTNVRKRNAGESPPGAVPENITTESLAIEYHIKDCKLFLQDMIIATKIGKKWMQGIEDFLEKIQSCSGNIALESAVIAGRYQEAKTKLLSVQEAYGHLHA